ncbi:MAG: hypothetical protein JW913_08630 [Chitinispirillaceae bacterium]|nr:hypothetical protein [Chitinispirillaceae bacterium]
MINSLKKSNAVLIVILFFGSFIVNGDEGIEITHAGPFSIGMGKQRLLSADIHSIIGKGNNNEPTKCAVKLIIKDDSGSEVYRDHYSPEDNNGDELAYELEEIVILKIGRVLLIVENSEPSAPGSGSSYRLFHFNSTGKFVPISGLIVPYCNLN